MAQTIEIIDADGVTQTPTEQVEQWSYFPSTLYVVQKPEFLEAVKQVSDDLLAKRKEEMGKVDEIYPVVMTDNFYEDPKAKEFSEYVGQTAWNILQDQGYNMSIFNVQFTEMWVQEHYKHSLMEQHVHGYGSQLIGFYFLDCPENCSRLVIHDPRPGKVQGNLPETNQAIATYGSNMINFEPKPGMLVFANSWLPHSFGRHAADEPIKFVHFNLTVNYAPPAVICETPVEII